MKFRTSFTALLLMIALLSCSTQIAPRTGESAVAMPQSKSIRDWVRCDGKTDDAQGAAAAFAAAKNNAFALLVDCPVFIHIGMDITRPIFIEDGTTVQFIGDGLFVVDNEEIPAFVFANTKSVRFLDWRVLYVGSEPIDFRTGGYYRGGAWIEGRSYPASAFNDLVMTRWLAEHRGLSFHAPGPKGSAYSTWSGPTNESAIFFLLGETSDLEFTHLKVSVPEMAKGSHFVPVVVSSQGGYKSGQRVTYGTPFDSATIAVPSNIRFSDIDLDGYYMGWTGVFDNAMFERIRAHRYGDLEDNDGTRVGGVDKWFAPPHLFYISHDTIVRLGAAGPITGMLVDGDGKIPSRKIYVQDVIDFGNRVGVARDRGGSDSISGHAVSLKIGAIDGVVKDYRSYRPDGVLDLLFSNNLLISNLSATYDSSFINHTLSGFRFPSAAGYHRITIENLTLVDNAAETRISPIAGCNDQTKAFSQVTLRNVRIQVNKWTGATDWQCHFPGDDNHIDIVFSERHP